jgi:hypothetical protein
MKSHTLLNTISRLAILALLLPAGMLAAQNPDSAAVSKLLEEVKSHAAVADDDSHTLASYTLSRLDWRSHAKQLTVIKEHVNNLISDSNQLTSMRDEASPWQQEAIDRISSLLPEMASHLTATINHLNDNQNRIHMKQYRDLATNNQTIIHKAHEIISDYVDYGEAKAKVDALEKQLQLPPAPETGS